MPPKHRQLHAPRPKASGNAFQALLDAPHDGNNLSFDGGDGRTDGNDDNTIVIANPRNSGPPALQQLPHTEWIEENIVLLGKQINFYGDDSQRRFITMDNRLLGLKADQLRHSDALNSKMENLLQKMDVTWTENTALREAYRVSREETAALKAAMDTLMKKVDENIATMMPPSPETVTSSTAMEEMMMQLSQVQHDIQDILDAVRNTPGKRKRRTSN
jgi:DNA-directed RNA polymerase subunit F